jgi:serine/threonine protein kinase
MSEIRDPKVGEILRITQENRIIKYEQMRTPGYDFDIPHAEIGKKAKVYKIKNIETGKLFGLKAFTEEKYRNKNTWINNKTLQTILIQKFKNGYTQIENESEFLKNIGFEVMTRFVITKDDNPSLCDEFPHFEYAVLMPWIEGTPWSNFIRNKEKNLLISKNETLALTKKIAGLFATLEEKELAHCDVSGDNIYIKIPVNGGVNQINTNFQNKDIIQLIDVEEIFDKDLNKPSRDSIPGGSPGYAHEWVKTIGSWQSEADRIALGILLCEIYTWHHQDIRDQSSEPSYFHASEIGTDCKRYQTMCRILLQENKKIYELFQAIWSAKTFPECPPISEWKSALEESDREPDRCQNCHRVLTTEGFCAICDRDNLLCSPSMLSFGKIDQMQINKIQPQKLRIQNNGAKDMPITVSANVNWVSIQSSNQSRISVHIPAEGYQEIIINLKDNLPDDKYQNAFINAIQVTGPINSTSYMIKYEIIPYWNLKLGILVLIGFLGLGAIIGSLTNILGAITGSLLGFAIVPHLLKTKYWNKQTNKNIGGRLTSFIIIFIIALFGWSIAGNVNLEEGLLWSGLLGIVYIIICFVADRKG